MFVRELPATIIQCASDADSRVFKDESSALTQAAAVDRADSQSEKWPSASSRVDDINSLCRRLPMLALY